jgi:glycosyltransferase involved in cell wall biosynthesis
LVALKGYPEMFRIYEKLIETCPEASLVIVGDGPERQTYEQEVQLRGWHRVHFVGHVQPPELPRYFAIADVFVFHTLIDAYGLVLGEAMAAGVPAVSSVHAAATRDLIEEGVTGFSIDPKDAVASAERILALVGMPQESRHAMVEAAYRRVLNCDSAHAADRMILFLESVLNPSHDRRKLKPTDSESLR